MSEGRTEKSLRYAEIGAIASLLVIILSVLVLDRNSYDPRESLNNLAGEQFRIYSDPPEAKITVVNHLGEDDHELGTTNETVLTVQDFLKPGEEARDNWSYVVRLSKKGCVSTELTVTQSEARSRSIPPIGQPLPELKITSPSALFSYLLSYRKGVSVGLVAGLLGLLVFGWKVREARGKRKVLLRYEADPNTDSYIRKFLHGYFVTGVLGQGRFGKVYRVLDEKLDEKKPLALKIINYDAFNYESIENSKEREQVKQVLDNAKVRFMREMETLVSADHPNICTIFDYGRDKNHDWVLMPVYDKSLKTLIGEGQPLPPAQLLSIAKQFAEGLSYAHEREIVHRDLKPENVMIMGDTIKIIDFGVAKPKNKATITAMDSVLGTAKYVAPEQVMGNSDYKVDQYPYGLILVELVTLEFPINLADNDLAILNQRLIGETTKKLREVAPHYSEDLENVVARMLESSPDRRYPTIMDAYEAFEKAYLAQTSLQALS